MLTNLPPHEDVVAVAQCLVVKVIKVKTFGIFVKGLKLSLVTKRDHNKNSKNWRPADALVQNRFQPQYRGPYPVLSVHILIGVPLPR